MTDRSQPTALLNPERPEQAPRPSAEPAEYGLGILPPLTALVELAAIVAVLLAIDWIWPALEINALQPSPYWLPVLLLTLQYGTASGSLAVIVAIIAYFAFVALPEQGVGENEFSYRLRLLAQPILWIGAAVILGQFRMVQIAAQRELTRQSAELRQQRDNLAAYAQRLRQRCDVLERAIATSPTNTGVATLDSLAGLFVSDAEPQRAIAAALATLLPEAGLSVYAVRGDGLQQIAQTPAHATLGRPSPIVDGRQPLYHQIVSLGQPVSIETAEGEAILDGAGLAAVPIRDGGTGTIVGMLTLDHATAATMAPGVLARMAAVAVVISPALVRSGVQLLAPDGAMAQGALTDAPSRAVPPAPQLAANLPAPARRATTSMHPTDAASALPAAMPGR